MQKKENKQQIKIVGKREGFDTSPEAAATWLKKANTLRGDYGICPRGVYRFKTFEEADKWMTQMLVRSFLEAQRSKISNRR